MKNYQCQNCKKDFNTREVHLWGKDKHSFCQSCNEKNKKKCSWCEKDLNCNYEFTGIISDKKCLHVHGSTTERWEESEKTIEERNFCDQNCEGRFKQYQENKPERTAERQKREELLKKGWKSCGWEFVPVFGWKCENLIPPTENRCENCQRLEKEREENLKKRRSENQKAREENEKKVAKAQEWWSSLSLTEKQAEIKKLEEEWIKKSGGDNFEGYVGQGNLIVESSIEFKNGRLQVHPEDLSKIPPPLLERFGVQVYIRNSRARNIFPGCNNNLDTKIKDLESKLQEVRKFGNKTEIDNLEREIQALKEQQKKNPNHTKNQSQNFSPKHSYWPWIVGISIISLIVLGLWITRKKKKKVKK